MALETQAERIAREEREWEAERLEAGKKREALVLKFRVERLTEKANRLKPWLDFLVSSEKRVKKMLEALGPPIGAGHEDYPRRMEWEKLQATMEAITQGPSSYNSIWISGGGYIFQWGEEQNISCSGKPGLQKMKEKMAGIQKEIEQIQKPEPEPEEPGTGIAQ